MTNWTRVATLTELAEGITTRTTGGHVLALCREGDRVHTVDNRCPHLGFPLDKGTVKDGILTCHWHHARFCTHSGGTFDPWADDVRAFPTELRDGEVWVDLSLSDDSKARLAKRLQDGLERNIPLIIAKAVIQMLDSGLDPVAPFRLGLEFGTTYNRGGWGSGLTTLVCMMRLVPYLDDADKTRALTHGLSAVAQDCAGSPPRFALDPLPATGDDADAPYRDWLRTFADTRDAAATERTIASAIRAGMPPAELSAMLMDAVTSHRYMNNGHVLDFINKASEALDLVGWEHLATPALGSLASDLAWGDRAEESRAWQSPDDLVGLLDRAFAAIPDVLAEPRDPSWSAHAVVTDTILGDDPAAMVDAISAALAAGAPVPLLARAVVDAAAMRIAQFHTSNEHSDWVRAMHSFTFANAVHQGLTRRIDPALIRGIYDAAMTVYLNRFLNIPSARLPSSSDRDLDAATILASLQSAFDSQQQVDRVAQLVSDALAAGVEAGTLIATLGKILVREDRDFHAIQMLEAAVTQYLGHAPDDPMGHVYLIAAARYMAAHFPTRRAQNQRHRTAWRLHKGDALYEESDES